MEVELFIKRRQEMRLGGIAQNEDGKQKTQ